MSGRIYFDHCIRSYLQAIHLMGECKFDEAKDALNEAIRWDDDTSERRWGIAAFGKLWGL